ncbi:MAG: GAF domain-containing sensor histidine kinase [Sorangiineae bacterium]|nr:GAF domain-containing sensor histidine kinase [Sorangiineae bacterium]
MHATEQALARAERISRTLREVGLALGTTNDLDSLLELVLDKVTELLEADRATLYFIVPERGELLSRVVVGQEVRSIRLKLGHGIAGSVAQTGKPERVKDAYADPRFEGEWDALTGYRTNTMLVVPLKDHKGQITGVLQVLNKRNDGEFTAEDEEILVALSTQTAVAIENSRFILTQTVRNKELSDTKLQLERRLRDIELMFELERATARSDSIESLALAVLGRVAYACEAEGVVLLLAEPESGDLVEYAFDAARPGGIQRFGVKSGEGIVASVATSGEVVSLGDARKAASWSDRAEGRYTFAVGAALVHPLYGEDGVVGALGLFTKRGGRSFTEEDRSLLRLVCANMSTAVRLFRASQERERGERLTTIGRLLSQVIHDFKTPMTVISGYVQLMQDADSRDQRTEYVERILEQFDVLTAMQREVLEFARGERTIFVRKVYLSKFFGDLVRQLGHEIDGRAVELEVAVDTKVVARFDEGRVARAIHNLARNAVEAMAERGGKLTISAGMEDGALVIRVADTGPGIPPEVEGRLFQSFVTAGKAGGTGLGLAIVKKTAEEHGGSVKVTSSPEGAMFELRLPQAAPSTEPSTHARRRARQARIPGDPAPKSPSAKMP